MTENLLKELALFYGWIVKDKLLLQEFKVEITNYSKIVKKTKNKNYFS